MKLINCVISRHVYSFNLILSFTKDTSFSYSKKQSLSVLLLFILDSSLILSISELTIIRWRVIIGLLALMNFVIDLAFSKEISEKVRTYKNSFYEGYISFFYIYLLMGISSIIFLLLH